MRIPVQVGDGAPFKVRIQPRSAAHAALIRRDCKDVSDELAKIQLGPNRYLKAV